MVPMAVGQHRGEEHDAEQERRGPRPERLCLPASVRVPSLGSPHRRVVRSQSLSEEASMPHDLKSEPDRRARQTEVPLVPQGEVDPGVVEI